MSIVEEDKYQNMPFKDIPNLDRDFGPCRRNRMFEWALLAQEIHCNVRFKDINQDPCQIQFFNNVGDCVTSVIPTTMSINEWIKANKHIFDNTFYRSFYGFKSKQDLEQIRLFVKNYIEEYRKYLETTPMPKCDYRPCIEDHVYREAKKETEKLLK